MWMQSRCCSDFRRSTPVLHNLGTGVQSVPRPTHPCDMTCCGLVRTKCGPPSDGQIDSTGVSGGASVIPPPCRVNSSLMKRWGVSRRHVGKDKSGCGSAFHRTHPRLRVCSPPSLVSAGLFWSNAPVTCAGLGLWVEPRQFAFCSGEGCEVPPLVPWRFV